MKLVRRLLAQAFWNHFAIVLVAFAGLQLIFRFLDESKLVSSSYTLYDTFYVALTALPFRLYQDLPYIVLIAVSTSMGALAQTSQITVLRAAGLTRLRLFSILALVLAPLCFISLGASQYGILSAEQANRAYKEVRRGKSPDGLWSRDGEFLVFASLDREGRIQEWTELETPSNSDWSLLGHLNASDVKFSAESSIEISDATRTLFFSESVERHVLPSYSRATVLMPDTLIALSREPELLRLTELTAMIEFAEQHQLNSAVFERTLIQRLGLPITLIALAYLGFQTAFGSWRSRSTAQSVFIAIGFGVLYKYSIELAGPVALLLKIPAVVGILIPLVLVVGVARFVGR